MCGELINYKMIICGLIPIFFQDSDSDQEDIGDWVAEKQKKVRIVMSKFTLWIKKKPEKNQFEKVIVFLSKKEFL